MAKKVSQPVSAHYCRECDHVTPVTEFHTLSLKGEPTLGECPYWNQSKCVLLSQKACVEHFKKIL